MAAVEVRNGYKYYGSKSKPEIVLNNLNMTVQPGSIYGLLGASGCGKTTLLSCLVGHHHLNGGELRVLGQKPGVCGSGALASRIGYMPQEIALAAQMSVKESIYYFGYIYGMTNERIREKFKSLEKLLELPPSSQLLENCSGGQQRRVSFACALIHEPELLILDMPTLDVDPMLREKIWDYLVETTKNRKTAVIITTHYIEEAKQANCIGLMRNGILLTEDTPENVMLCFEVNSIEEVFLILSQRQGDNDSTQRDTITQLSSQEQRPMQVILPATDSSQATIQSEDISNGSSRNNCNNKKLYFSILKGPTKALFAKNIIKMSRNPAMVFFLFLLPFIALSSFYMAIGKPIKAINLGIFNSESNCEDLKMTTASIINDTCFLNNISCHFIRTIASTDFIKPVLYQDLMEAHRDAKKGYITGYIHVPKNFSSAMQGRIENGGLADDYAVEQSILATHLDMGAGQTSLYTGIKLLEHFQTFIQDILAGCDIPANVGAIPVAFKEPIYGSKDAEFQQHMAPGFILTMIFFINTMVTGNIFIEERNDGVWNRTLIAGVSSTQLLCSHLLTQLIMMIVQNAQVVVLFMALGFSSHYQGNAVALVVLLFLVSVGGMLYGLVLSVYCKSHIASGYISSGTFYVMIILCGFLWPMAGMPKFLQTVVLFTPFTLPSISASNIIERGWEITNSGVYRGYLVIIAWIIIFYILCIVGVKRKM